MKIIPNKILVDCTFLILSFDNLYSCQNIKILSLKPACLKAIECFGGKTLANENVDTYDQSGRWDNTFC